MGKFAEHDKRLPERILHGIGRRFAELPAAVVVDVFKVAARDRRYINPSHAALRGLL